MVGVEFPSLLVGLQLAFFPVGSGLEFPAFPVGQVCPDPQVGLVYPALLRSLSATLVGRQLPIPPGLEPPALLGPKFVILGLQSPDIVSPQLLSPPGLEPSALLSHKLPEQPSSALVPSTRSLVSSCTRSVVSSICP